MTYDLTLLHNSTTLLKVFEAANVYSGLSLMLMIIFAIFFIMLLNTLTTTTFPKALVSVSFVCFIMALFLTYAGLLNFWALLLFATISGVSFFYLVITDV